MSSRRFRADAVFALTGLVVAACSSPTTVIVNNGSDGDAAAPAPTTTSTSQPPIDATPPNDGAVVDASDAATDAGQDVNVSDASDAGDSGQYSLVFGTTTYAAGNPGQNANMVPEHPMAELPLQGKNCYKAGGCHSENNHKWGFAGTVYANLNGSSGGVKNAEVRVVNAQGTLVGTTFSDDDGNFWFDGPMPMTGNVTGVRTKTNTRIMATALTGPSDAQCNSGACHGNAAMRIYIEP